MAQEKPNPLIEWILLLRAQAPVVRQRFNDWFRAVRDEPVLLWATPAVRYIAYGLGALIVGSVTIKVVTLFEPPPPAGAKERAVSADFHVVCSESSCAHHFVIHRPFGFDDFPVTCPRCKRDTGRQARLCNSKTCHSRWVAPVERNGSWVCPICGSAFE